MGQKRVQSREGDLAQFQHTQLGVYLAGAFGLCYVWCSSAQGIVDRYHFSKKWFYLYGVLVAFAYLYMRPFVRRGLGSAHRGYVNFYSLYILWLCTALFCHLPSLEALGLDIRSDVTLALSIAASSLLVLGVLHGLQVLLIHFKWLAPAPGATQQALWSCIVLNSITLSAACSTYFQLCGNGAAGPGSSDSHGSGLSAVLHDAVCVRYLAPIATQEYPKFSAWMLYGEGNSSSTHVHAAAAAAARQNRCSSSRSWFGFGSSSSCEPYTPVVNSSSSLVEFVKSVPVGAHDDGGSVISPVFTMWITLVTLYIINVVIDHVSAAEMSARHISELRRERVKDPDLALLAALSQAAGETFRQGAHQLAAAQQQRHQQQPEGQGAAWGGLTAKRSRSMEHPPSVRQPWSPRCMAERTLVNLLETTSSFSFKAAALLEGLEAKGFPTWQQLQSQARLGSLGLGGLTTLGDRLGSIRSNGGATWGGQNKRQQQQLWSKQQQTTEQPQLRRASTDGGEGIEKEQQQKQQRQRRQPPGPVQADWGVMGGGHRPARGLHHKRSKSLGSIQSAGTASGKEDDELLADAARSSEQQQQQQPGASGSGGEFLTSRQGPVKAQQSAAMLSSQQQQRESQTINSTGGSSNSLHSLGSNREPEQQQQQQHEQQVQDMSRVFRCTAGSLCNSPFAMSQNGVGFGAYGGFGSAVSLYSPVADSHEARALEHLLATAATADGMSPAAAGQQHECSSRGLTGGGGAQDEGQTYDSRTAAAGPMAPAPQAAATAAHHLPVDGCAATGQGVAAPPPPPPLQLPPRGTSQDSGDWSDLADGDGLGDSTQAGVPGRTVHDGPSPPFLDMVPWYSGTSADLFKTMFDLMISLKLFLGRFDMRTMQAATAASMADSFNDTPSEGDGFTYEHYHSKEELWFDFIADTGDGGNSTYAVARALAAPSLTVPSTDAMKQAQPKQSQLVMDAGHTGSYSSSKLHQEQLQLPRGEVLLIGGDLAYPNPSRDTYEQRLFVPFQEAMPPPPHYHPGRLVVHKPDLPPAFGVQEGLAGPRPCPSGLSPRSSRYASVAALRGYAGPNVFAIPGNHDWIDGLETFIKHIMHKGWLGGWLMPQEKSYFSLRLPAGWWVFGLDLALVGDIDMCQYRYFANVVERRVGPDDNVIIITHEPTWLLEWFWASSSSSNLRQLVRGHLRGRARVHLAGDLHFYMRHSFVGNKQHQKQQQMPAHQADAADGAGTAPGTTAGVAAASEFKVAAADELLQMPSVSPSEGLSAAASCVPVQDNHHGGQGTAAKAPHSSASAADNSMLNLGLAVNGNHSRRTSSSSSSSSGIESCNTPLQQQQQQFVEAALNTYAAADTHSNKRTRSSSAEPSAYPVAPPAGSTPSPVASSSSSSMAKHGCHELSAASPVDIACQTLPRLVVAAPTSKHSSDLGYNRISNSSTSHSKPAAATVASHPDKSGGVGVTWAVQDDHVDGDAAGRGGHRGADRRTGLPDHQQQRQQQPNLLDPEHLIVNGMGGAFLHPTHVFSYSRFACLEDEAAAATAAIYSSAEHHGSASYMSAVPLSSGSSSSSLATAAAAGHQQFKSSQVPTAPLPRPSTHSCSMSAWDPELLSWHCPMSPGGASDIWDQHSLQGLAQLSLGPAAAAEDGNDTAGKHANGPAAAWEHDPVPVLAAKVHSAAAAADSRGHKVAGSAGASASAAAPAPASSGVYKCAAAFPSAEKSLRLGRKNLHLFRFKNSRFDVIGGAIYFLSIVSTLPRCNAGVALLSATSLLDFISAFLAEFAATWHDILMNSYLSLLTVGLFFLLCLGFAKGGGVGAVSGERQQLQREQKRQRKLAQQQQQQQQQVGSGRAGGSSAGASVMHQYGLKKAGRRSPVVGPLVKLRTGGTSTQLLVAALHAGTHLSLAVVLLLLLELGVEVCIKYEQLGNAGHHSMYHWFEAYQDQHFPDPMGLRDMAHRWSCGLYPGIIKAAMAVYDIPEAIAVARNAVCSAGNVADGFAVLSRVQVLAYYAGMLAYYWMLAIPAMGFVFGLYLYVCVCWFHVHYDEAFSALRIVNFKGLTRMHITKDGDLEIFTLGYDRIPTAWREDPRWYGQQGAGSGQIAAHAAAYPSRWIPAGVSKGGAGQVPQADENPPSPGGASGAAAHVVGPAGDDTSMGLRVVDYLKVPRQRPGLSTL